MPIPVTPPILYFFVKANRPNSDGKPLHGFAKGFFWEHGMTGPHPLREAKRIMAVWSGQLIPAKEGHRILDALRSGEEDTTHFASVDSANIDPGTIDEAILDSAGSNEGLPEFEDIGYHAAVTAMREAGFDYEMAGGGRKKEHVQSAWELFRSAESGDT